MYSLHGNLWKNENKVLQNLEIWTKKAANQNQEIWKKAT